MGPHTCVLLPPPAVAARSAARAAGPSRVPPPPRVACCIMGSGCAGEPRQATAPPLMRRGFIGQRLASDAGYMRARRVQAAAKGFGAEKGAEAAAPPTEAGEDEDEDEDAIYVKEDGWYVKQKWQGRTGEADATMEDMTQAQIDERNDNLIEVFQKRERKDFRKLVVFSKEWPNIKDSFFARIEWTVEQREDPDEKMALKQLLNVLQKVDAASGKHNATWAAFAEAKQDEWEGMVGRRRKDLTPEFFEHMKCVVEAMYEEEEAQDALATRVANLSALTSMHDQAIEDNDAMVEAAEVFQKEILGAGTLEEADKKIDELAAQGRLDPALMLTMAKAWAGANEKGSMVEEDAKDIMHHLYMKMKATTAQQQPKEVRILKYLLSIEDPSELAAGLEEAFTPGAEFEMWEDDKGDERDMLWCTPDALLKTITAVLQAYDNSGGKGMTGETARLMQPVVVERMRSIQMSIIQGFT